LLLAACAADDPTTRAQADEIIGGVSAKGATLDAIGSLSRRKSDGTFEFFCTATLIAPRLVLTAKHCAAKPGARPHTEDETIVFGVGDDSRTPKRTVKLTRTWMAELDKGGYIERGSDVAVLELEAAIEDIAPLPVVADHVASSFVRTRVSAVGYGIRDLERTRGLRRAGTLTLQTTGGSMVQGAFETLEELRAFVEKEAGDAYDPEWDESRVDELWRTSLLDRHELFAGAAPGDAQPCNGDSGGPLVARTNDGLVVLGVVSGSFKLRDASISCSVVGEIYATFPEDVQAMFDMAGDAVGGRPTRHVLESIVAGSPAPVPKPEDGGDRCAGVSVSGVCDRGAASRCTAESEGVPHVTRTDCTLLLQACSVVAGTAECVDR
jgi:secreted trypsin-like serine protease